MKTKPTELEESWSWAPARALPHSQRGAGSIKAFHSWLPTCSSFSTSLGALNSVLGRRTQQNKPTKLRISPSILFEADPSGWLDEKMQLHFSFLLRLGIQSGTDQTQGLRKKKNATTFISPYDYQGIALLFFLPISWLLSRTHTLKKKKKKEKKA